MFFDELASSYVSIYMVFGQLVTLVMLLWVRPMSLWDVIAKSVCLGMFSWWVVIKEKYRNCALL